MGTSQSSRGPGSGVPMVPPWTPELPTEEPATPEQTDNDEAPESAPPPSEPAPVIPVLTPTAPVARFQGARGALHDFAKSGDARELRRALGHYTRSGYGGAKTITRRFGGAAATAGMLGGVLASMATGEYRASGNPLDPALLDGRTAQEVMDAVVEAVRPVDGTQDAEAERAAIRDSLVELLSRFPEADLQNLNADQRTFAIEQFAAIDVFRRFELDLGKTIYEKAPNKATALARLKEARDYIKQSVAAAFRKLSNAGRSLTSGRIDHIVCGALQETFEVFEGYAE